MPPVCAVLVSVDTDKVWMVLRAERLFEPLRPPHPPQSFSLPPIFLSPPGEPVFHTGLWRNWVLAKRPDQKIEYPEDITEGEFVASVAEALIDAGRWRPGAWDHTSGGSLSHPLPAWTLLLAGVSSIT